MTDQELQIALTRLGLKVPKMERQDIANAIRFLDEMAVSVRKPRAFSAEPAYVTLFPHSKD